LVAVGMATSHPPDAPYLQRNSERGIRARKRERAPHTCMRKREHLENHLFPIGIFSFDLDLLHYLTRRRQ